MAFKTSEKYKSVIYSGDCRHKLKLLFNGVELEDADVYCESLKVTSRIIPNGSTRFSLDNFVAKETELVLHDIDTTIIQSPVNISIGTLVDGTYEYVPIGLFVVQDLPTTDKNKTTIKLRDYAVKFDFGYNAKDIIDENGGSATKLQILQDICNKAGVETDITKFYGSNSKIGIYDNSITARTYISYLAEQAGAIATIDRSGKLIFIQLKDLETVEIPLNIVEKYEDGEKYEISRVVYEDAIRKFEYGDESKDTLFINTANPYIDDEVLTNTLTGTQIETSDSADAEVVNYKQYGITKQETTTGKNLAPMNWAEDFVSRTNNNNLAKLETKDNKNCLCYAPNAGYGDYDNKNFALGLTFEENTQYTISYDVLKEGTFNGTIAIYYTDGTYTRNAEIATDVWTHQTLTSTAGKTIKYIAPFYTGGTTYIDLNTWQIEKGTTATSYEKPTNGASPNPDYPQEIEVATGSVSVKSNSNNMFNSKAIRNTTIEVNEDGSVITMPIVTRGNGYSSTETKLKDLAPNLEVGDVVFINASTTSNYNKFIHLSASNILWKFGKSLTITESDLNSTVALYGNRYQNGETQQVIISDFRITKNANDEFEPYKESSITYNLGDNFLADKDYIENGVLHKNIGKVVLNGSENIKSVTVGINSYAFNNLISTNYVSNKVQVMSNFFKGISQDDRGVDTNTIYTTTNKQFIIRNTQFTTVNEFKQWLSENKPELYYELATPEQIQLETTGELRTFEPNTIITNSLDSEMEVEYARNQTQVSQILELNKDIPINSFKTGKIIGNPAIDAYDIIKIVDGNKEFKTLATNDLTYNGVMINTFDTQIGKEAKKENVTLTPEATFKKWAKTEIDNVEAEVRINTGNIQTVKDEMGNIYTKGQVNELVANAETGVTNTFSEAGGNNEIRNSSLWFKNTAKDAEENPYEFWKGKANEGNNDKATNSRSILLGKGSFIHDDIEVPNGNYSISFYYRKLISNAVASVVINGKEYPLDSLETKQFYTGEQDSETGEYIVDPIVVSNNHIKIEFKCDALDGVEVYDLMCNKGTVKLAYSQNQNEITTSTVNISKGITITSSVDENTKFKADYDGIRVLDGNNNPKTTFTDKGTETDELVVRKKATITGLLHQEVDDQTWVTKI